MSLTGYNRIYRDRLEKKYLTVFLQNAIIGKKQENRNKLKGEVIMGTESSIGKSTASKTGAGVFDKWKEGLAKIGQRPVWASWLQGTYIKKSNLKAQSNVARLLNRKYPDIKEKVVLRRGKNVRILYNRKTGGRIPTKGMSPFTRAKIEAKNDTIARQRPYFAEKNALKAIAAMLHMPRNLRRSLCRKLNMKWGKGPEAYIKVEAMLMEA